MKRKEPFGFCTYGDPTALLSLPVKLFARRTFFSNALLEVRGVGSTESWDSFVKTAKGVVVERTPSEMNLVRCRRVSMVAPLALAPALSLASGPLSDPTSSN